MKKGKLFTKKNILKIIWVLYAFFSVFIWLPRLDALLTKNYEQILDYVSLDDSWDITINDTSYQNVSLGNLHFPAVNKGDQVTMERVLPETWDIMESTLRIYIKHAAVRAYIDNELIYEYGYDRLAENKTVGSGYQFINFPEIYAGKTLKIHYYLAEDKAFTKLDPVQIYAWENALRTLITENRLPMFLGCFLVILGLAAFALTAFALAFSRKFIRPMCVSLFSLCMGLWTLCQYNILLVFSIPLYSISLIKYISLYLGPLPLVVYMYEDVKNIKYKIFRVIYWALFAVLVVFLTVAISLHLVDIVHMAATLKYMQMLILVWLALFLVVILMNFKSSKAVNRLYLVGMLVIIGCSVYDLVGYNADRYMGNNSLSLKGVSSMGVMVFILILFFIFYLQMMQRMMQEKERDFLIKSAYTDELTSLNNRRYCMEYMSKIRDEKNTDYTVVCFDLNNLKTVNDTLGHAKGDILIKSAADVLKESFIEHGIVARMGGDEFIAILTTSNAEKLTELMEQFQENIARKNKEIQDLNMSIAYGYASGTEIREDIEKVYHEADNRMYEKKKQMKQGRQR